MATLRNPGLRDGLDPDEERLLKDDSFQLAGRILDAGGVPELVEEWTHARTPAGRPLSGLTYVQALQGFLGCFLESGNIHIRAVAEYLHTRPPAQRRRAGIPREWPGPLVTGSARQRQIKRCEKVVLDRLRGLEQFVDPLPLPKTGIADLASLLDFLIASGQDRPEGERGRDERRRNLERLIGALLQGSIRVLPVCIREQLPAVAAVDGTFIPTYGRRRAGHVPAGQVLEALIQARLTIGFAESTDEEVKATAMATLNRKSDQRLSQELEAGYYVRYDAVEGFGYEGHLAVAHLAGPSYATTRVPMLILGLALDTPGFRPGPNAIRALRTASRIVREAGRSLRLAVFDSLYPNLKRDSFHLPLRLLGIMPIFRLAAKKLGKSGVTHQGLQLVEGTWYCAEMPDHLVRATKDFQSDLMTDDEYRERLRERELWQAQRISGSALIDGDGQPINHRYECPGSRRTQPAFCPRKPSEERMRDGQVLQVNDIEHPPKACLQSSITIPFEAGVGVEQAYPYGSPEWLRANRHHRSVNEGANGRTKDLTGAGLENKGVIRVGGYGATSLMVAIVMAGQNIKVAKSFIYNSERQGDGSRLREYPKNRERRPYPLRPLAAGLRRRRSARDGARPVSP